MSRKNSEIRKPPPSSPPASQRVEEEEDGEMKLLSDFQLLHVSNSSKGEDHICNLGKTGWKRRTSALLQQLSGGGDEDIVAMTMTPQGMGDAVVPSAAAAAAAAGDCDCDVRTTTTGEAVVNRGERRPQHHHYHHHHHHHLIQKHQNHNDDGSIINNNIGNGRNDDGNTSSISSGGGTNNNNNNNDNNNYNGRNPSSEEDPQSPSAVRWRSPVVLVRAVALAVVLGVSAVALNSLQFAALVALRGVLCSPFLFARFVRWTERMFGAVIVCVLALLCGPLDIVLSGDHDALAEFAPGGGRRDRGRRTSTAHAPPKTVIIANHQIYTDWCYFWVVAWANGAHGDLKIVLKEDLKWIPVLGWGMQFFEFIFLARKWSVDGPRLTNALSRSAASPSPLWLLLFPEGTVVCDEAVEAARKYKKKIDALEGPDALWTLGGRCDEDAPFCGGDSPQDEGVDVQDDQDIEDDDADERIRVLYPKATGLRRCLQVLRGGDGGNRGTEADGERVTVSILDTPNDAERIPLLTGGPPAGDTPLQPSAAAIATTTASNSSRTQLAATGRALRPTGTTLSRGTVDTLFDVCVAYEGGGLPQHLFPYDRYPLLKVLLEPGVGPRRVHMHYDAVPVEHVPGIDRRDSGDGDAEDEAIFTAWLRGRYDRKRRMLTRFAAQLAAGKLKSSSGVDDDYSSNSVGDVSGSSQPLRPWWDVDGGSSSTLDVEAAAGCRWRPPRHSAAPRAPATDAHAPGSVVAAAAASSPRLSQPPVRILRVRPRVVDVVSIAAAWAGAATLWTLLARGLFAAISAVASAVGGTAVW
ncbi:acyltransferase-domain-containing protein [Zopfochytrium polystomum]|nr:acyltransferase-domain-containing protein [Zopfochytrium polystomum]